MSPPLISSIGLLEDRKGSFSNKLGPPISSIGNRFQPNVKFEAKSIISVEKLHKLFQIRWIQLDVVVFVKSVGALEEFRRDNETKNKMRMLLTYAENNDLESVLFDEFSTNDYMSQLEMTMKTLVVVVLNLVRIAFSDEGRPQVCSSISATRVFFNPAIKEVKELIDRLVLSLVCDGWVESDYARRRKEEALTRRRCAEKAKNDAQLNIDESELFCIKINRTQRTNIGINLNGNMGKEGLNDGNACYADSDGLVVNSRRKEKNKNESNNRATDGTRGPWKMYKRKSEGLGSSPIVAADSDKNAEEGWNASVAKRQKVEDVKLSPKSAISSYAGNLRKLKTRIRRDAKRKRKGEKENISDVEMYLEDVCEVSNDTNSMDSGFVFTAGRNRRMKNLSEGAGSNHHALAVDCCYCEERGIRTFKFEANWVHHDDFLQIVDKGWNEVEGAVEDSVSDLIRRMNACREKLIAWSKVEFPNYRKVIEQLKHMLHICHKGIMTAEKLMEAEDLVKQIEDVWNKRKGIGGKGPNLLAAMWG
ncbi:hypothetical protein K1719_012380 [Acacia pycnantha]|nr:hypothetical protein K1719_012380 [Acacia pycnantha]